MIQRHVCSSVFEVCVAPGVFGFVARLGTPHGCRCLQHTPGKGVPAAWGKVRARRADVHGVLHGDLVCNDLVLRASSRLQADLTCASLTVETGAEVEGSLRRPAPPAAPAAEAAPQTLLAAEADLAGGTDDAEG